MYEQEQILKRCEDLFKDEVNAFWNMVSGAGEGASVSRERNVVITFPGESWENEDQFSSH